MFFLLFVILLEKYRTVKYDLPQAFYLVKLCCFGSRFFDENFLCYFFHD